MENNTVNKMENRKKKKSKRRKVFVTIGLLIAVIVVQTLPAVFLKPFGSETMKNDMIDLTYQPGDEAGAREVFDLLNEKSAEIYDKLDYERKDPIEVYIYKTQNGLAIREAGLITIAIAPDWHIGDSHNGNIMMVSPNTKVASHTHDSILNATLHELVHSITFRINPDMPYFIDNGLATYLSGQTPAASDYDKNKIPSQEDMQTENGLTFANMGGYAYSYFYIQYLDETYGWDKVVQFAKGEGDYNDIFGKSEAQIHADWTYYLGDLFGSL
jgi:hypothetical protein